MKTTELRGDDYLRFSKIVYTNSNNESNLSELINWEQPLKFKPNTYILQQKEGGPCGLFAVLNSHIVLKKYKSEIENTLQEYLFSLVLDILKRVSSYSNTDNSKNEPVYIFCDCLIPENNFIHFQYTESFDEAYKFLTQTRYMDAYNSCLMLTLSIIFASLGMNEFRNVPEFPYISYDKMTSMSLVWLMLNGSTSSMNLQNATDSNYGGLAQKEIGIKVLDNPDRRVIGTWLNPDSDLFVCLNLAHFFVIREQNDNLAIFDSMTPKLPYTTDKKFLNWENVPK